MDVIKSQDVFAGSLKNVNLINVADQIIPLEKTEQQRLSSCILQPNDTLGLFQNPSTVAKENLLETNKTYRSLKSISAKQFYSAINSEYYDKLNILPPNTGKRGAKDGINVSSPRQLERRKITAINRGVFHKIRRNSKCFSTDIDLIINNMRNEKLCKMIANKREEKKQIEKIHNIFRNSQNPITMSKPLSVLNETTSYNNKSSSMNNDNNNNDNRNILYEPTQQSTDFSDIECESDEDLKNDPNPSVSTTVVKNQSSNNNNSGKKFFKSDRSHNSQIQIKITNNISVTVRKGKLSLLEEKKPKFNSKIKNTTTNEFSDEQAIVDAILKQFDKTFTTETNDKSNATDVNTCTHETEKVDDLKEGESDFNIFWARLPYKTTEARIIDEQQMLLNFLICNNICTEENFTIFIVDPKNNIDKISQIVKNQSRLSNQIGDQEIIKQQHHFLDFLIKYKICTDENLYTIVAKYDLRSIEGDDIIAKVQLTNDISTLSDRDRNIQNEKVNDDLCIDSTYTNAIHCSQELTGDSQKNEKLFPIFNTDKLQLLPQQSNRRPQRIWNGLDDAKQYQIDAGQKKFGAHQCKQCGLVYTLHESEEEKLHRDFHSSLHVLRFRGWIDEDLVAFIPEWGPDGRILRITETSEHRRLLRLMDVLKIVDKELGFYAYKIPKIFVAFLAARKSQIVGVCLVEPLEKANKIIRLDRIDYCSKEEYNVKCGISRIWVSPLHRRMHIATKLLRTVQTNTMFGERISFDKIAFSTPTEEGKNLARKVTNLEHFLVYQ